jgi:hypothetical protein
MPDQTAIDVYERDKYSQDHREHRYSDGDTPEGSPIQHNATLTESVGAGLGRRHRGHQAPGDAVGQNGQRTSSPTAGMKPIIHQTSTAGLRAENRIVIRAALSPIT